MCASVFSIVLQNVKWGKIGWCTLRIWHTFCPGFSWMIVEMRWAFRNMYSDHCDSMSWSRTQPTRTWTREVSQKTSGSSWSDLSMQKHGNKRIVRQWSWHVVGILLWNYSSNGICVNFWYLYIILHIKLWTSAFPACLRCVFASLGSVETQEELHCYLAVALYVCLSFQHRVTEREVGQDWMVHFGDMDRYRVYKIYKGRCLAYWYH